MKPLSGLFIVCLMLLSGPCVGIALSDNNVSPGVYKNCSAAGSAGQNDEWGEDPFAEESEIHASSLSDPLEPFNRVVFSFNDKVYIYVLDPLARGFRVVFPERVRISILQFFSNLETPVRFANCLLQGKFHSAASEFTRFCINTTIGVAGLFDPAKAYWHLKKKDEDFGQTLGHYGEGQGFYLVLPLLGPSSLRGVVGDIVDLAFDPMTYLLELKPWFVVRTTEEVDYETFHIGEYEDMKRQAVDPYLFMKSSYLQYREQQVKK